VTAPDEAEVRSASSARPSSRKLALDDIADLRAYEREREAVRAHVRRLRERRRVRVGPFVTFSFENRDTVRFQVQEVARIGRIITDAGIEAELAAYNPHIPEPGQLSATMVVDLGAGPAPGGSPELEGVERVAALEVGGDVVRGTSAGEIHLLQPTHDDLRSTVHYLRWELTPSQVEAFALEPVALVVDHPAYRHRSVLLGAVVEELLEDLRA
jgi:hypothetical protein